MRTTLAAIALVACAHARPTPCAEARDRLRALGIPPGECDSVTPTYLTCLRDAKTKNDGLVCEMASAEPAQDEEDPVDRLVESDGSSGMSAPDTTSAHNLLWCRMTLRRARRLAAGAPESSALDDESRALALCVEKADDDYFHCVHHAENLSGFVTCEQNHSVFLDVKPVVYQQRSHVDFDDDVVTGDLTKPDGEYVESDRCAKALRQVRRLVEGTPAAAKIDGDKALARCAARGNDEYFACVGGAQTIGALDDCERKQQGIVFAPGDLP